MTKGPEYDERIWAEHEAAMIYAAPNMSQLERDERTYSLYSSCLSEGRWAVSILDAGLVTLDAIYNALIGSRFEEAILLAERFFEHPDIAQADGYKRANIWSLLGAALLLTGEVDRGLSALAEVNKSSEKDQSKRGLIRSSLAGTFDGLGESTTPDDRIRDFAVQFLNERKSGRPAARKAEKVATYADLLELLYP